MIWTPNSIALVAGSLFLGSIPFSYLVVRARTGTDLRKVGSGNPGATNALRAAGPAAGLTGLVLDTAKGLVPVWLAREPVSPARWLRHWPWRAFSGMCCLRFWGFKVAKGSPPASVPWLRSIRWREQ